MTNLSSTKIQKLLANGDQGTINDQGKALEDLICYIFGKIPGVTITKRNKFNVFQTEEIDVAIWNTKNENGLDFLSNIILIECKNWSERVNGTTLTWFVQKVKHRARKFGIFIARNGITGDSGSAVAAHEVISDALKEGIEIVIIRGDEIESLTNTDELVKLIQNKLCTLAVSARAF